MSLKLRLVVGSLRDIRFRMTYRAFHSLPLSRPTVALAVLIVGWGLLALLPTTPVPSPYVEVIGATAPVPRLPKPWPLSIATEAAREVDIRFSRGSTLAGELSAAGVDGDTAAAVVAATREVIDVRKIRPGQEFELYFNADGTLAGLRYPVDRQTAWFVARDEDSWATDKVVVPIEVRSTFISAEVSTSLYGALENQVRGNHIHDLLLSVADVYGWDVDFNYELQPGDQLDLVVEERFVEGAFIGYGDILAAEFQVGPRVLPVVRYVDGGGRSTYYAPDGASLRRTFLRSPVKYTRISSRFSPRRVHPVTGIARAHRGVDYVADPGTPVQATADGVVIEARYGAEPGRYVKVRHRGSYSSVYMHLSRYQEGIKPGSEVRQGDVIGYVGKTGNATGYHLHYGLQQGGRWVDPSRLEFPSADPVPTADWQPFAEQRDAWFDVLRAGQSRRASVVAGGL